MPFLALLWLALLHSLSPVATRSAVWAGRALAATEWAGHGSGVASAPESKASWAVASAPSPRHALRAPVRTAAAIVSQSSGVVIPDRSEAPPLERASHHAAEPLALGGSTTARARHQSIAPRGSVLPYFPTAPPLPV